MAVWRLQTHTSKGRICTYCRENHVAAVGWSLSEIPEAERKSIRTFDEYLSYADSLYDSYDSVKRMANDVREGDLIWIRSGGRYYIGRVGSGTKWVFNTSDEAMELDACNQLDGIDWYSFAESDESAVPGAISTAFIKGSTFQRINKSGVQEYSALLYDKIAGTGYYTDIKLSLSPENFYSLLSPEDCEDLLCFWLYQQYGYICIPSTNKLSTPLYECVLLDPASGAHVYIQVKKGGVDINADDYRDLNGVVWFLTTEGHVQNLSGVSNMHVADPQVLYEFALSEESDKIMSPSIKTWLALLTEQEDKRLAGACKGVMFDTNRTHSGAPFQAEKHMLRNRRISAWGSARKYIRSFNLGDYALYYSKAKGIIAIGKITSQVKTDESCDESYCEVEPIVFPQDVDDPDAAAYIRPGEIKQLLNKNFYFASTRKTPSLTQEDVKKLIHTLRGKQTESTCAD